MYLKYDPSKLTAIEKWLRQFVHWQIVLKNSQAPPETQKTNYCHIKTQIYCLE